MPKLKTNRGAKKRFRTMGSGKIKRKRSFLRHILTSKGKKQKRQLRRAGLVHPSDESRIRRLLPYG